MHKFAKFLVDKGLATEAQIVEALDDQRKQSKPIGRIALEQRVLSMKQVFTILAQQEDTGKKFGETAQDLKWLSNDQVEELLQIQENVRPRIGSVLVDMGVLDKKNLRIALKDFETGIQQSLQDVISLEEDENSAICVS